MSGIEVAVAMSIFSGAMAIKGGMDAKSDAKRAAANQERMGRENAVMIEAEGKEQQRRAQIAQDKVAGEQRARANASGTTGAGSGSQATFIADEEDKFQTEIDWLKKSTASQSRLSKTGASNAASVTRSQGDAAMWGGLSSGIGTIGSAYSASS